MHCRLSPSSYKRNTKTLCLKLSAYSFIQYLYCNFTVSLLNLRLAPFLEMTAVLVSVGTMQLTLSIAIIQVTTSCCIHAGFELIFCYRYVGGSFCCNYAGDCFCYNYAARSFCITYAGDSFCSKYMGENF